MITVEEAKARMKFREIEFEELKLYEKIGIGPLGAVYRVLSLLRRLAFTIAHSTNEQAVWRGSVVTVKIVDKHHIDAETVELFKQEAAVMHILAHHPSLASFVGAVWYGLGLPQLLLMSV